MTREEVVALARQAALREGWTWIEPIKVMKSRRFLVGAVRWTVISNADAIGANVRVEIDDATGQILRKNFTPR